MTSPDDPIALLGPAHFAPDRDGLLDLLDEHSLALSLLSGLLLTPDDTRVLQSARALLDRASARRAPRTHADPVPSTDYVGAGWPDGGGR